MVIRPNRPRTIINEKNEFDKLYKKSKKIQNNSDIFSNRKYLRFALIFGITGFCFSKIIANNFFVKKSNKHEIKEYQVIEENNQLKEYNWMTKLLKIKELNSN